MLIDNPWEFFKNNDIKKLKRELHPDKHGGTPKANKAFTDMMAAYELSKQPQPIICGKVCLRELINGDFRKVWRFDGGVAKQLLVKNKTTVKLVEKENSILVDLRKSVYAPYFVKTTLHEDGSIEEYDERLFCVNQFEKFGGRHVAWILRRLLVGLGFAHMKGYCHNAIYPEHILIAKNHAGVLTGWVHADKIGQNITVVSARRKSWYTSKVGSSTQDIIMLSKSIQEISGNIPKELSQFIKGMQYNPPDCWKLEEEFGVLLEKVYGPPKFINLDIEGKL